jgi:HTH-type transcriptional repressor of NAD biosynthesis genes
VARRYRHGLVVGKFYPPHAGHHLLIRAAAAACDSVTVLVEAASVESISLAERVTWLRAEHEGEAGVTVVGAVCDVPIDMADEQVWVAQLAVMSAALRGAGRPLVEAVFSSENYGDELAERFGAVHVCVDPGRTSVPVSGTAVRNDLAGYWHALAPATRAGLTTRVVVVGAESTGTTTMAKRLAEHYARRGGGWGSTAWVPEYGREYTVELLERARASARAKRRAPPEPADLVWTPSDFVAIAARQTELENAAAAAGSPLLVCDTDAFATAVWERRYLGSDSRAATAFAGPLLPRRDLYLLTDSEGVPFEQDGLRDGEAIRAAMTGWFVEALSAAGHPWVLLTGTREQRLRLAVRSVDQTLQRRMRFTDPLA